jgi:Crp-like helix-turn-helix domain
VCSATHSADRRFCRWLLTTASRGDAQIIPVTQDEIANLLGVHRATVALIARRLERADTLGHARGRVIIRNRAKLLAGACDCCTASGRSNWPATRLETLHATSPRQPSSVH